MAETAEGNGRSIGPDKGQRLDSWKEIAAYLKRDVSTVNRWEKSEGLPVHRHVHKRLASVYAYRSELDAWMAGRVPEQENGPSKSPRRLNGRTVIFIGIPTFFLVLVSLPVYRYASLWQTPIPFQQQDMLLITRFANETGEPLFEGALEYALERELVNSTHLRVVSMDRIRDTLRLMRKAPDTVITPEVGKEISLRDGDIKALVAGTIRRNAPGYTLGLELIDPHRNVVVTRRSHDGRAAQEVLDTIRPLAGWVRESLGEVLPNGRGNDPQLEKVTTPSLRALQLYSRAMDLGYRDHWELAAPLLRECVAEDPDFASAHILLAWALRNTRRPAEEFMPHAQRAFDLAHTTGERESFFIRGSYYRMSGDTARAIAEYEALVAKYPDHYWGINNLAQHYQNIGSSKAITYWMKRADLRPGDFAANAMVVEALPWSSGDAALAEPYARRARDLISEELLNDNLFAGRAAMVELFWSSAHWSRGEITRARDEFSRVEKVLESKPALAHGRFGFHIAHFNMTLGRLKEARRLFDNISDPRYRYEGLIEWAFLKDEKGAFQDHMRKAVDTLKPRGMLGRLWPITALVIRAGFTDEAREIIPMHRHKVNPDAIRARADNRMELFLFANEQAFYGELALARGAKAEALKLLHEAVPTQRALFRSRLLFLSSELLSRLLEGQGDMTSAISTLEEVATQSDTLILEPDSAYWPWVRHKLLRLYRKAHREEDARRLERELRNLLAYADADHPILVDLRKDDGNRAAFTAGR